METKYPIITDELITALKTDFPNVLPTKYINDFELGKLLGQQEIINKLIAEKEFNEQNLD